MEDDTTTLDYDLPRDYKIKLWYIHSHDNANAFTLNTLEAYAFLFTVSFCSSKKVEINLAILLLSWHLCMQICWGLTLIVSVYQPIQRHSQILSIYTIGSFQSHVQYWIFEWRVGHWQLLRPLCSYDIRHTFTRRVPHQSQGVKERTLMCLQDCAFWMRGVWYWEHVGEVNKHFRDRCHLV